MPVGYLPAVAPWQVKSVDAEGEESSYSADDSFVIIPTFGQWAVLLLGLGMAAYWVRRQRHRAGVRAA